MNINLKAACVLAVVALSGFGATAEAQLQITEIHYNVSGSAEVNWEYIEVYNAGGSAIDLDDGWVGDIGDFYRGPASPSGAFNPNIITDPSGGAQPLTNTVINPGSTAVLFDGFATGFDQSTFRTAWSLDSSVQLIPMQFKFAPFLSNSGEGIGIWGSTADYQADVLNDLDLPFNALVDETGNVGSFTNTLASLTYDDVAPWPTDADGATDGVSISWSGASDYTDGSEWYATSLDTANAVTSTQISGAGEDLNSTDDFGSPGLVFGTPSVGSAPVIITEIMYNPRSTEQGTTAWEWVEIYNNTGSTLDFSDPGTRYFLDDDDGGQEAGAELMTGSIPDGGVAVLYDAVDNNLADMQAAWGAGINFIPVDAWPGFSNSSDSVAIWDNETDYLNNRDPANDSTTDAISVVFYDDSDSDGDPNTLADNWPEDTGAASIYLVGTDTSGIGNDQTIGANWSIGDDPFGFNASQVSGTVIVHEGGDVGTPGHFAAFVIPTILEGDFNDDGTVDAADYTIWRDNLGGDASTLNGNGDGDSDVDIDDYNLWAGNFGASSSSSAASAVPEPAAALLMLCGVAGLVTRRNG